MAEFEHWHVTLTLAGDPVGESELRAALERLLECHPFLESCTYGGEQGDTVEVRYWEQAETVHDALAMALRLWGDYRDEADLPAWSVTGLEVLDRRTYRRRTAPPHLREVTSPVGMLRRLEESEPVAAVPSARPKLRALSSIAGGVGADRELSLTR